MNPFGKYSRTLETPANKHFPITPDNANDLPVIPKVVYCRTAGDIVIRDVEGVDLTYTMEAGQVLLMSPVRVLATGTTGVFYGWN